VDNCWKISGPRAPSFRGCGGCEATSHQCGVAIHLIVGRSPRSSLEGVLEPLSRLTTGVISGHFGVVISDYAGPPSEGVGIPPKRNEDEQMREEYINTPLPGQELPEDSFCAECQGPLPRIAVVSLNRPQRYCSEPCRRKGFARGERWRAIQEIRPVNLGTLA